MPNKLTSKQVEELIEARKQGVPLKELAEKYNVSCSYISQLTHMSRQDCVAKVWDTQTRMAWRELHALVCHIAKLAGR